MAVASSIVDDMRISHHRTEQFSDRLQTAETSSVIPGPNQRISGAAILLIICLSSFDKVKYKWFARWPFLRHSKDDMAFAVLTETDRSPGVAGVSVEVSNYGYSVCWPAAGESAHRWHQTWSDKLHARPIHYAR